MTNNLYFKITILGDDNVGKSSVLSMLSGEKFDKETSLMTLSIDYILDNINIDNKKIQVKVFDTPGIERLRATSLSTVKFSEGIILLFSVDNTYSFNSLNSWLEEIIKIANSDPVIYIVGNKIDIENRKVLKEEGMKYAEEKGLKYYEVSAMNEYNIKKTFLELYEDIYNKNKNNLKYNEYLKLKKNYMKVLMKFIDK